MCFPARRALAATLPLLASALVAGALAHPAVAKKRPAHVNFGGTTASDAPFILTMARSGRALRSARVVVRGKCADGSGITLDEELTFPAQIPAYVGPGEHDLTGGRLDRRGAFHARGVGAEDYGDASGAFVERLDGKVRPNGTASGTYSASIQIADAAGTPVASCTVGPMRWTARSAPGRVFTGTTSAREPLVVELDGAGRKVGAMRFVWYAGCMPDDGYFFVPDHLGNFPVRAGRFGDTWQDAVDLGGGSKRTLDYVLSGRVRAARASGTFSVKVTDTDAAGGVTSTCETGTVSWSAVSG